MTAVTFQVEGVKFSQDNIPATLACLGCGETFQKEFPIDLEGQTVRFHCPVCHAPGEADLPYRDSGEEPVKLSEDLDEVEVEESDTEEQAELPA
jgi:hypothetical protein